MKPQYFDYNATTPVLPEVFDAMRPFLTSHFGNPSSGHMWGLVAKRGVDRAREQLAAMLAAEPSGVVFTSCATESNALALWGVLGREGGGHLITSAVEHPAIMETLPLLQAAGHEVTVLTVDGQGLVNPDDVAQAIKANTRLISIMTANNETGVIQPIAAVSRAAKNAGVPLHTDASQAVGKIPLSVKDLGVDLLTVAGHKMYAPKGVGALLVSGSLELTPMLKGGGQEAGRRAGTENVASVVALGAAAELAAGDIHDEVKRQLGLGNALVKGLAKLGVETLLHGARAPRLPNTAAVGFKGLAAGDLLSGLVTMEVGASAGAACHGEHTSVSHVLTAMGVPDAFAHGTLRFSWGRPTTSEDVDELIARMAEVIKPLRPRG